MHLNVRLYDDRGNLVDRFQGPPELAIAFAARFLYLHGLDPVTAEDPEEGERCCQSGSVSFDPVGVDYDLGEVEDVMEAIDPFMKRLDEKVRKEKAS